MLSATKAAYVPAWWRWIACLVIGIYVFWRCRGVLGASFRGGGSVLMSSLSLFSLSFFFVLSYPLFFFMSLSFFLPSFSPSFPLTPLVFSFSHFFSSFSRLFSSFPRFFPSLFSVLLSSLSFACASSQRPACQRITLTAPNKLLVTSDLRPPTPSRQKIKHRIRSVPPEGATRRYIPEEAPSRRC